MNTNILKESNIHGDVMFPMKVYSLSFNIDNNNFDCHWHDELEFIVITKGKAIFQINTINYEVSEGDVLFINSGDIHVGYPVDKEGYSFCAIVFHYNLISSSTYDALQDKYIEPILKSQFTPPRQLKGRELWEREVAKYIKELAEIYFKQAFGSELLIKSILYSILYLYFSNLKENQVKEKSQAHSYKVERLKKVLNHIQKNYEKKITIGELSKLIGMSEGHFCRFFKSMVRKTPVDYINNYRVNQASIYLKESDKKIFEIALDVGFENFSYFINTFKQYKKCTPSEYRGKEG